MKVALVNERDGTHSDALPLRSRQRGNGPGRMTMVANRGGLELLARLGYAARGAVSLFVGGLALLAAFGRGGGATGSKGALQELLFQPLGDVLLAAVALGLFGFAVWRALQSLLDADGLGSDPKALVVRAGQAVSAIVHAGLGVFAVSLLVGWGYGGGDEERSARDWTRWLLAQPLATGSSVPSGWRSSVRASAWRARPGPPRSRGIWHARPTRSAGCCRSAGQATRLGASCSS